MYLQQEFTVSRFSGHACRYVDDASCVWVLIGNKNDMAHARAVSVEEAAHFAKSHNMSYVFSAVVCRLLCFSASIMSGALIAAATVAVTLKRRPKTARTSNRASLSW